MGTEEELKNQLSADSPVYRRDDHRFAAESGGEKGKAPIVSNSIRIKATKLLVYATLVTVAIVHTTPSRGQDADIKKQLEGVDLEGVQQLRLSPNGELVAGLTKLYENPGKGAGSFSLVKIWSVKKKQLLHQFRVPGAVYEAVFSPDSSILVSADKTGNLGYTTTLRVYDLMDGSSEKVGFFSGLATSFASVRTANAWQLSNSLNTAGSIRWASTHSN